MQEDQQNLSDYCAYFKLYLGYNHSDTILAMQIQRVPYVMDASARVKALEELPYGSLFIAMRYTSLKITRAGCVEGVMDVPVHYTRRIPAYYRSAESISAKITEAIKGYCARTRAHLDPKVPFTFKPEDTCLALAVPCIKPGSPNSLKSIARLAELDGTKVVLIYVAIDAEYRKHLIEHGQM